jgi:hypothetical protein
MATVTPNFNWPVPTSTDLVRDGATAIEALGDSIDGSLVDLKGGTTGQVLSKTSGTDMDFTWVTTDDANAIQNSIVDAKGDLISATANDTPARLAVGSNGETLVADSSTSTGLRYQAPVNANPTLNSAFQVWQRGTSIACTTTSYTADRWQGYRAVAGSTVSRQATGDTTNLPFIQYSARVARDSGNTSTSAIFLAQSFESVNSIPYAGKTVTMSFYARAGANYSSASSILGAQLYTGTGTDQNYFSFFTGGTNAINTNATLTTTWQRFTYTATLGATVTQLATAFSFTPVGTAGANDWFEITGVQIEVGSVATPFKTYAGTIQGELAACQRYFQVLQPSDAFQDILPGASCDSTSFCRYPFVFPTIMRRTPTCSNTGSAGDYGNLVAAGFAGASAAPSFANIRNTGVTIYVYSSSVTTGQGTCLRNSSFFPSQWLTFSAEL